MLELGKMQMMMVLDRTVLGIRLQAEDGEGTVILPGAETLGDPLPGDTVEVFLFKDEGDRLTATMKKPKLVLGQLAALRVAAVSDVGAFLNWGLERDLFLPFREQKPKVKKGETVLVCLFIDRNQRLAASMDIYRHLSSVSPYRLNDRVRGTIYSINPELGAFVAVDGRFQGLIPAREFYGGHKPGDQVEARVAKVRDDGKLELSLRQPAYLEMDNDAALLLAKLQQAGGSLPINDESDPEEIKAVLPMSKRSFKRAVGRLLKDRKIQVTEDGIVLLSAAGEVEPEE